MNRGAWYAFGAYVLWGILPFYWKALGGVGAMEILSHRLVWALVVAVALVSVQRNWGWFLPALRDRRTLLTFAATATLISINWLVYIWAVNAGHIVETSLGYFINPLVNVLLGVVFLKERPRPVQIAAILIALLGVLYLTVTYGSLPWIALALALSFAFYGLLRKTARLQSLEGLTLETMLIAPFALAYVLFLESQGGAAFGHAGVPTTVLLAASGIITAIPLLMFATGARQITMTLLGILQYVNPTLQFLIGVAVYHETLNSQRLIGFCIIWTALALYTFESIRHTSHELRLARAS